MTAVAIPYREFELPWSPAAEDRSRFRRVLGIVLALFVTAGVVIPLLPVTERPAAPPQLPDRVVELVLEEPKPPPKPPEPVVKPKEPPPEAKPEAKPVERTPVDRVEQARQKAAKAGLLAFKDELAELRDAVNPDEFKPTQNLTGEVSGPSTAERSLITAGPPTGSGGINTAALSRGYGSGPGSLHGHSTTQVAMPLAAEARAGAAARRSGPGQKASRSREEIELVFDRNKAAIYAIYNRALRDNPALQGKIVIELTIQPSGEITAIRMVSSELGDSELERKLLARIRLFRFADKDVEPMTTTKPIEFFPS